MAGNTHLRITSIHRIINAEGMVISKCEQKKEKVSRIKHQEARVFGVQREEVRLREKKRRPRR